MVFIKQTQRGAASYTAHKTMEKANKIISAVCEAAQITEKQLLTPDRSKQIALARHVARWQMVREGMTYQAAAEATGATNHATTLHSHKTVNNLLRSQYDPVIDLLVKFMEIYEPAREAGKVKGKAKGNTLFFSNTFKIGVYNKGVFTHTNLLTGITKQVVLNSITCEQVLKLMRL